MLLVSRPPCFVTRKYIRAGTVSYDGRWACSWRSHSLLYPPLQRSWKGGILVSPCLSVRLSVCGQNRVRSVSSPIRDGSISHLHILSRNVRTCVVCNNCFIVSKLKIWYFGEFFKFVTLTLSPFDLGSNMMGGGGGGGGGILRTQAF